MARVGSANARMKSNKAVGKGMLAYVTGHVPSTASLPAKIAGRAALGPVGDVLLNPATANANEEDLNKALDTAGYGPFGVKK